MCDPPRGGCSRRWSAPRRSGGRCCCSGGGAAVGGGRRGGLPPLGVGFAGSSAWAVGHPNRRVGHRWGVRLPSVGDHRRARRAPNVARSGGACSGVVRSRLRARSIPQPAALTRRSAGGNRRSSRQAHHRGGSRRSSRHLPRHLNPPHRNRPRPPGRGPPNHQPPPRRAHLRPEEHQEDLWAASRTFQPKSLRT